MRKLLRTAIPHLVLIVFSLMILLPLLWIVRVSLTDKLTAYKIPPEIGTFGVMNYVEMFAEYSFLSWFANSLVVALAATAISLPLATAMAYAFARFETGGSGLRLGILASQMLPPIILVLPLFGLFLAASLMQSRLALIIAHLTIALPFLAWMLVSFFAGDVAAAGGGGAGRRRQPLAGLPHDRGAGGRTRHPGGGAARFHTELERVPVRARPVRPRHPDPAGGAGRPRDPRRRRDRAAGRRHRGIARSGVCAFAVFAQASDQGTVARGPQVTVPTKGG